MKPFLVLFFGLSSLIALQPSAHAKAHCYCRLQSQSTTVYNFGEIASYNTQIGHDSNCAAQCNDRASHYFGSNQASACAASHGGTVVAFYAVGSKSYQSGKNYACPQTGATATKGSITFGPYQVDRQLFLNEEWINFFSPPAVVTLPPPAAYATFKLNDVLPAHVKPWTYTAKLYRDNVLVEELSKTSSAVSVGNVWVVFTSQPANTVHGHVWKVEWHYFAPGFNNGSTQFRIN